VALPLTVAALDQSRGPALADIIGARPGAHGRDGLLGVDPLQVDRGGAEIGMAELALDDVERDASRASSSACAWRSWCGAKRRLTRGEPAELGPDRGARPRSTAGRAVEDAEQRPDRQLCPCVQPLP
jgi:hypothetical protein